MTHPNFKIKIATSEQVSIVLQLIKELAEYEHLTHLVTATEETLRETLFGNNKKAESLLLFEDDKAIGFAIYFYNYSTFLAKPGIYLEDLYIQPPFRNKGYGKALLQHLAAIAVEQGCGRFEWSVLDWNEPSIQFYNKIGALPQNDWILYRLSGEALNNLARKNS